jgi:hypothetical protein
MLTKKIDVIIKLFFQIKSMKRLDGIYKIQSMQSRI